MLREFHAQYAQGEIAEGSSTFTLATNDQLLTAADFANIVIKWKNDAAVKLQDIANVFDSTVNDERAGWFDSDPAVVFSVVKTPMQTS